MKVEASTKVQWTRASCHYYLSRFVDFAHRRKLYCRSAIYHGTMCAGAPTRCTKKYASAKYRECNQGATRNCSSSARADSFPRSRCTRFILTRGRPTASLRRVRRRIYDIVKSHDTSSRANHVVRKSASGRRGEVSSVQLLGIYAPRVSLRFPFPFVLFFLFK